MQKFYNFSSSSRWLRNSMMTTMLLFSLGFSSIQTAQSQCLYTLEMQPGTFTDLFSLGTINIDLSAYEGTNITLTFQTEVPECFTGPGPMDIMGIQMNGSCLPPVSTYSSTGGSGSFFDWFGCDAFTDVDGCPDVPGIPYIQSHAVDIFVPIGLPNQLTFNLNGFVDNFGSQSRFFRVFEGSGSCCPDLYTLEMLPGTFTDLFLLGTINIDLSAYEGTNITLTFQTEVPECFTGPGPMDIMGIQMNGSCLPPVSTYSSTGGGGSYFDWFGCDAFTDVDGCPDVPGIPYIQSHAVDIFVPIGQPNQLTFNLNGFVDNFGSQSRFFRVIGPCSVGGVPGCTDPLACNFDPAATIDDGSCEYLSCAGCTDPLACNFDPAAILDDGSCEYLSCAGCTDPLACNFDPAAILDDGSCEYLSCAGCADPGACNYDPAATIDDGSCEYLNSCGVCTGNLYTAEFLPFGPTFLSEFVNIDLSVYAGSSLTLEFQTVVPECFTGPGDLNMFGINMNGSCLPPVAIYTETGGSGGFWDWFGCDAFGFSALDGCPDVPGIPYVQTLAVDIQVPTGQPNQLSFNLDAFVDNFGTESRFFYITATNCAPLTEGCDDPLACNYDPLVDYNDGSCIYPGCIDPGACNFNPTAGCDDGSCTYPGCTDTAACNYNPASGCDDGSCTYPGCTDPGAVCNFDPTAGCDDGSCEYLNACGACTGNLYTAEFLPFGPTFLSEFVNIDLSVYAGSSLTLEFQTVVPECFTGPGDLNMFGINMNGSCLPPVAIYTETGGSGGFWDWFGCDAFGFSALDGCPDVPGIPYVQTLAVDIQVPTGQPNQLSFNLDAFVDNFGTESRFFYITATNCAPLTEGCDDPLACNYDPLVDYNDGSCIYPGCIDPGACNFNPTAGCDDGSCTYPGCTDTAACNYNPASGCDDGSCTYPGCTDPGAVCNFDPTAGCDDGSCEYLNACGACTGNLYTAEFLPFGPTFLSEFVNIDLSVYAGSSLTLEFQTVVPECFTGPGDLNMFGINMNGSCLPPVAIYTETGGSGGFWDWFGCDAFGFSALDGCPDVPGIPYVQTLAVDIQVPTGQPNQLSFNLDAFVDNFGTESRFFYITATNCSPLTEGCDDPLACNYDPLVDYNDGSCLYVLGCTDPLADNYDPLAECDDASCVYGGCTYPSACNYDPTASSDDGSCDFTSCEVFGCTYPDSPEYNSLATIDDGSCTCSASSTCPADLNGDGLVNTSDLLLFLGQFGTTCP